jgi:hypothetical protein
MTKQAPKFNVEDIKCNGWGSYCTLISKENQNAIQTFVSVYRKAEDFENLVSEMAINRPSDDFYFGRRCKEDDTITGRITSALGSYAMLQWDNSKELAEMWINAQIEMFTGKVMATLVKDALRDCAGADHWYTFEKDWN